MAYRGRGSLYGKSAYIKNKIIQSNRNNGKKGAKGGKDDSDDEGDLTSAPARKGTKISLQICSESQFQAPHVPSRQDIEKIYKATPGYSFLVNEKPPMWMFPLHEMEDFKKRLMRLPEINLLPPPKEVFKLVDEIKSFISNIGDDDLNLSELPAEMVQTLLPFQINGIRFAVEHEGKVLIGDEMGLGKTIQAIAIATVYRQEWPLLVVVPTNLREQWRTELCKWLPFVRQRINVVESGQGHVNDFVNIIGYSMIAKFADKIEKRDFQVIICDESHYLKTSEAQRTAALLPIVKAAKRRILLSGTPALSRPAELYPQLKALDYPIFSSMHKFGQRYCNAKIGPRGWDYSGHSNLAELNFLLKETCMIRRMKDDVLDQIPKKSRHFVQIAIEDEYKGGLSSVLLNILFLQVKEKMNKKKASIQEGDTNPVVTEYYMETGKAKVSAAGAFVLEILIKHEEEKILVFAHHLEVLDGLAAILDANSIDWLRIDGTTSSKEKEKQLNIFRKSTTARVFLLSITCAGVGLNLTSASVVIFAELYWNPGSLIQAEDRAHRIGQEREVHIYYLMANQSVDDLIFPLIQRKLAVVGRSVNGQVASMYNKNSERIDNRDGSMRFQNSRELDEDPIEVGVVSTPKSSKSPSTIPKPIGQLLMGSTPKSGGKSIFGANKSQTARSPKTLDSYFTKDRYGFPEDEPPPLSPSKIPTSLPRPNKAPIVLNIDSVDEKSESRSERQVERIPLPSAASSNAYRSSRPSEPKESLPDYKSNLSTRFTVQSSQSSGPQPRDNRASLRKSVEEDMDDFIPQKAQSRSKTAPIRQSEDESQDLFTYPPKGKVEKSRYESPILDLEELIDEEILSDSDDEEEAKILSQSNVDPGIVRSIRKLKKAAEKEREEQIYNEGFIDLASDVAREEMGDIIFDDDEENVFDEKAGDDKEVQSDNLELLPAPQPKVIEEADLRKRKRFNEKPEESDETSSRSKKPRRLEKAEVKVTPSKAVLLDLVDIDFEAEPPEKPNRILRAKSAPKKPVPKVIEESNDGIEVDSTSELKEPKRRSTTKQSREPSDSEVEDRPPKKQKGDISPPWDHTPSEVLVANKMIRPPDHAKLFHDLFAGDAEQGFDSSNSTKQPSAVINIDLDDDIEEVDTSVVPSKSPQSKFELLPPSAEGFDSTDLRNQNTRTPPKTIRSKANEKSLDESHEHRISKADRIPVLPISKPHVPAPSPNVSGTLSPMLQKIANKNPQFIERYFERTRKDSKK